jgi:hypothetical protein
MKKITLVVLLILPMIADAQGSGWRRRSDADTLGLRLENTAGKMINVVPSAAPKDTNGYVLKLPDTSGTLALLSDIAGPKIFYVSPTFTGRTSPYFTTIKAAINAADSNYTIYVYAGNYAEVDSIHGKKSLQIIGYGQAQFDGTNLSGGAVVTSFRIDNSSFVTIRNFGIDNYGGSGIECLGLIGPSDNITVTDIVVKNGANQHAIIFEEAGHTIQFTTVSNVKVFGGTHGYIFKSSKAKITNCSIRDNNGIGFGFISDNINDGLLSVCYDVDIINCTVTNTTGTAFTIYAQDHYSETNASGVSTVSNIRFNSCTAESSATGFNVALSSFDVFPKISTGHSQVMPEKITYTNCTARYNDYNWYVNRGQQIKIFGCIAYGGIVGYLNEYSTNDVEKSASFPTNNTALVNSVYNVYGFDTTKAPFLSNAGSTSAGYLQRVTGRDTLGNSSIYTDDGVNYKVIGAGDFNRTTLWQILNPSATTLGRYTGMAFGKTISTLGGASFLGHKSDTVDVGNSLTLIQAYGNDANKNSLALDGEGRLKLGTLAKTWAQFTISNSNARAYISTWYASGGDSVMQIGNSGTLWAKAVSTPSLTLTGSTRQTIPMNVTFSATAGANIFKSNGHQSLAIYPTNAPTGTNDAFTILSESGADRFRVRWDGKYFAASANIADLTALRVVETDASKNLISIAKQTGYNLALGLTAGTVAEGNHAHPGYAVSGHGHESMEISNGVSWRGSSTGAPSGTPAEGWMYYDIVEQVIMVYTGGTWKAAFN